MSVKSFSEFLVEGDFITDDIDWKSLNVILDSLDKDSDLYNALKEAIDVLKEIAKNK